MNMKSQIEQDVRSAMKARSEIKLSTLRMLMAALKQQEIDRRVQLSDGEVVAIVDADTALIKISRLVERKRGEAGGNGC